MSRLIAISTLLLTLFLIVVAWYLWRDMQSQLDTPINIQSSLIYTIKPGMSLKDIGDDLVVKEILDHFHYFLLEGKLKDYQSRIKAGEYLILPNTTPRQLLAIFLTGKVKQHSLTLIEGWTYKQMMQAINANSILVKLLPDGADNETVMQILGYSGINLEGRFFPDTYYFPAGTTDIDFLHRAYMKMLQVLEEEWENKSKEHDLPYQTPGQALIVASIIEKEAVIADEHVVISGVFSRRLKKGMKLQADPTVIYAMGDTYQGKISRKNLKLDSPYNTYRYKGLPPTPIALASKTAIHAALHPQPGNVLYFVAKGDHTHHFSATLQEHNAAVNKYLRSQ